VSAATKILELALRSHEIEDLTERLDNLERSLEK
jgi:tetrahydromethanopterin S-methyltransferase subunit G